MRLRAHGGTARLRGSVATSPTPAAVRQQQRGRRSCIRLRQHAPPAAPAPARCAAAAAAAAAAEPAGREAEDPQGVLADLFTCSTYQQLAAFVQSRREALTASPLCVSALLHAAQLRDTLSDEQLGKGSLESEEAVMQQLNLVEQLLQLLCDAAVEHVPALPLPSQATLALALAQLDYYHAPLVTALAASARQQLAGDGLAELPEQLVPGVLLSLAVAASLAGHYDEALLDALAQQAVAFRSTFGDAAPLLTLAAALLDLQHYSPQLLEAAAQAAVAQAGSETSGGEPEGGEGSSGGSLQPEEVISLLLSLGFFRVSAPEFVELALEALSDAAEELLELEPLQLARLWRALLLLKQEGVVPPPQLVQLLCELDEQLQGDDVLLLGACPRGVALALAHAGDLEAAHPALREQWEQAGVLAPVRMLQGLQALLGCELQHRTRVSAATGAEAGAGDGALQLPPAVVDVSCVLPDGRRVAIMVLDEVRYCNAPPTRLRGAAAVDVLALQALGLAVLPLPVAEWQALDGDAERQRRYLQARVAAATG